MQDDVAEARWAPRLSPHKIRRVYESEARGLLNEELLEEVFIDLYLRCKSIVVACRASVDMIVTCPRCEKQFPRAETLICPECGWSTTWKRYHASYKGQQLHGYGALAYIQEYIDGFSQARTSRDKLMLIDTLIHRIHDALPNDRGSKRSVGINLIQGKQNEVTAFVESLAYDSKE